MTINKLMDELYKGMQSQSDKKPAQKTPVEKIRVPPVPKATPAQMDATTSMVGNMEL